MRWRAFGILTTACALTLSLVVVPATAASVKPAYWTDWTSFTRIGFDGFLDSVPESWDRADVQGDWVVWQKTVDAAPDWNVYAYSVKSRTTTTVSAAAGSQTVPRVYGNWVVYQDARWGNAEIYAFNLSTSAELRLTSRAGDQIAPDISGTMVAYTDVATGDIYCYDLAKGTDTLLPLGPGAQSSAHVSGHRVVYVESNDIFVYDMTTGAIARLTTDAVADSVPDIDGTLVAWQRVGTSADVWAQDLAGGVAAVAVSTVDGEGYPRVSGKHVVFFQATGGTDYNIGVYDKLLNHSELVATATTDDYFPAIDGLNIVYTGGWGTAGAFGGDIALGRLNAPSISAKPTARTVPLSKRGTIAGSITENGIPLGLKPLAIDASADGGHTWSLVATLSANAAGDYSYTTAPLGLKTWYRVRYDGDMYFFRIGHFSALSSAVSVTPMASVGRPVGYPKTGRKTKSYSVHGSLKPRQAASAAAAKVVVIKCYRLQSGKWKLRKTVSARVYDYSTYSRYGAKVKLTLSGKWRMRASFQGSATNAAKNSTYTNVKVR